jgi:hypothetical protein
MSRGIAIDLLSRLRWRFAFVRAFAEGVAMIGTNWIKGLAIAGAAAIIAAAMPMISSASTHYTGKTPASIAMMATTSGLSTETVSLHHHSKHVSHHVAGKRVSYKKTRHSLHKKHHTLSAKKKHTI